MLAVLGAAVFTVAVFAEAAFAVASEDFAVLVVGSAGDLLGPAALDFDPDSVIAALDTGTGSSSAELASG
jgi:hypothetical protein